MNASGALGDLLYECVDNMHAQVEEAPATL
jgi:hypothetical protein